MADITADYLGGDPDHPSRLDGGTLVFAAGAMSFSASRMVGVTMQTEIGPELTMEHIRAISIGDANQMRALTRGAAGVMLGGAIGGLIGMATGRRSTLFVVAGERDGFTFAASFAAVADDARGLLHAIQRGRRDRGLEPLPQIADLEGMAAEDVAREQLDLLQGIREQLAEQTALLREIVRQSA